MTSDIEEEKFKYNLIFLSHSGSLNRSRDSFFFNLEIKNFVVNNKTNLLILGNIPLEFGFKNNFI